MSLLTCCFVSSPLCLSVLQLPFSLSPLQVSTSSRIKPHGKGMVHVLSTFLASQAPLHVRKAFCTVSQGLWASPLPPSEPSGPSMGHPLGPPQRSLPGCPGPYQATWIWYTWSEPSGPAGHQELPALLIRAPHEAGQGYPQRQADKRDRLAPWSQGLDVSPMGCIHEEGWEELLRQKLQIRIDQGIFLEQVHSLQVQEPTGVPDTSWLCFRRNPVENASEHIIHVRPSRSRPKTISQPFRGIYSGLRLCSGRVDVPQLGHMPFRPQWAQSYSSFPIGFRTSLSQVPMRRNGNHQPIQFHTVLGLIQVPPGSG